MHPETPHTPEQFVRHRRDNDQVSNSGGGLEPARELARRNRIPMVLLVEGVRHGLIPIPREIAEELASQYKSFQDDPLKPIDESRAAFFAQVAKQVRADRESSKRWTRDHKRERNEYMRDYMRDYMRNRRKQK